MTIVRKLRRRRIKEIVNFSIRIAFAILIFSMVGIYFISPISHSDSLKLEGNIILNRQQILSYIDIDNNHSLYALDENVIKNKLLEHAEIKNPQVILNPFSFIISYEELAPSYIYNNNIYDNKGNVVLNYENNNYYQSLKDNCPIYLNKEHTSMDLHELNLLSFLNGEKNITYISYDVDKEYLYYYYQFDEQTVRIRKENFVDINLMAKALKYDVVKEAYTQYMEKNENVKPQINYFVKNEEKIALSYISLTVRFEAGEKLLTHWRLDDGK